MCFDACAFGIVSMKSLPNLRSLRFVLVFSSKSFIVLTFKFSSGIYLELIFVYGVRWGSEFILLHMDIQLSQPSLLQRLFLCHCLGPFVKNQLAINVRVYFWSFNSVDLYICPCASTIFSF